MLGKNGNEECVISNSFYADSNKKLWTGTLGLHTSKVHTTANAKWQMAVFAYLTTCFHNT